MPKINQPTVMNTMIPLPPLAEQQAIVARVEALLDDLTQQVRERRAQAAWLQQAVLREALGENKF